MQAVESILETSSWVMHKRNKNGNYANMVVELE